MNIITPFSVLKDKMYLTGIFLTVISLAVFCVPSLFSGVSDDTMGFFAFHFVLAGVYFGIIFFSGRLKKGKEGIHLMMIFLVLFLISAYALNREMTVFEKSTEWFTIVLFICCVNILLFAFIDNFLFRVRYILCFVLGVSMVVFIYLALYLLPLYAVSAFGFFLLFISLHTFVPLLFCIYILVLLKRMNGFPGRHRLAFAMGAGSAVTIILAFIINWCMIVSDINKNYRRSSVTGDGELLSWVKVAQAIPHTGMSEKILKTDLVYGTADLSGNNWFWGMPSRNFDEERKHDPLVMTASLFSGKIRIPMEERVKILEAMYDSRHQAQERLWRGDDLLTDYVNTDLRIWPDLRLAYTEMVINVFNSHSHSGWRNEQEAIYTFHLPQGGVVTSLSLWIAGREQKGILTTKAKADSAYKTIVGVESRDPSVVHWQEGNTVSVRVFPVMSGESRIFKVGITSPLGLAGSRLMYEPVYFDGPSIRGANEDMNITFMQQSPANVDMPSAFTLVGNNKYNRTGGYNADWKMSMDAPAIRKNTFSFDGKSYSIQPWQKRREPVSFSAVFMDINSEWSAEECNGVYNAVKDKKVYVAITSDELVELTDSNKNLLYHQLRENHFSLFPFHKIANDQESLVISKTGSASPSINDLKNSDFLTHLQKYFSEKHTIRLYNLGENLSPYLKSLKEFRAFRYEEGDVNTLNQLLRSNSFASDIENEQQVVVDNAGISITQAGDSIPSDAPDHLMRLFAYNHILKKAGTRLLSGPVLEEELIGEAEQAYVVSPVSSLVVLETQADYDRFDIKNSKNSLRNASAKSKGAVPEPHEWALIIIVLITVLFARFRPSFLMVKK